MRGQEGKKITVACNYIRLKLEPEKGVFEYEVTYEPPIESRSICFSLLNEHKDTIGATKTFDGRTLYLPFKLPQPNTHLQSKLPNDQSSVLITLKFIKRKQLGETIHLFNVLFRRIMNILGLALMGRHFFDPNSAMPVPAHKLEVWPGYITAVDEYEGGLMLCCDASHRVLRTQTVYNLMEDIMSMSPRNWKEEFMKLVVGQTVLTRYNSKTYRVDDVIFTSSPMSTFDFKNGTQITYYEYYLKHYNIQITDRNQPLIVSRRKGKVGGKEVSDLVCLVPELCFMTGLTDNLRNDMKVMKDIATCTRISPMQRKHALNQFIKNVNSNENARLILDSWGLVLEDGIVNLQGRLLDPEDIYFGDKKLVKGSVMAEWSRALTSSSVLSAIELVNWMIVCLRRDEKAIVDFVQTLRKCGPQMGIGINPPRILPIPDDSAENYVKTIRNNTDQSTQLVVIVFPSARNDKYSAVKKLCCSELGVASQVIQTRTIRQLDKLRSIAQKIALQINCKLGGTLWTVKIPMKNTMVCGIDTYHDPTGRGSSIAALVASLNQPLTRWFSQICKQVSGRELMEGLTTALLSCLTKYHKVNGYFPEQILMFRDGVGDGQLSVCQEYECPQFLSCCNLITQNYKPNFLMVVVQKRIKTRIFMQKGSEGEGNPMPGSIVDHSVTRRDWYDFFLVSQNVRQGTVSPTHYIVVHNSTNMTPDQVQRVSYKLTHLYYNWPGTVRVPAPCQYAHKLAYLVGESTHKEACEKLCDKLYYL
ncbi:hypothetical protein AAG570_003441 [Ranatra chinensis]|uniref:Uncharacterized protein n=1 Tax=Ranatra chinensis TaxID=642074 RepID=A0ABD0Y3P9_9HEMI